MVENDEARTVFTLRCFRVMNVCLSLIHLPISRRVASNFSNSEAYISINFCPLSISSTTPGPSISNLLTNSFSWKCKFLLFSAPSTGPTFLTLESRGIVWKSWSKKNGKHDNDDDYDDDDDE